MGVALQIRRWVAEIIQDREDLISLAIRQRAKFEGWLKFELACRALREGATQVVLEAPTDAGRADVSFKLDHQLCVVELKTSNTNWRIEGINPTTRPITKNIQSIIADVSKLRRSGGVIVFVLFPIPRDDQRWITYLQRIADETSLVLSAEANSEIVSFSGGIEAGLAVVAFEVDAP
jgi:hypothetical protein